MDLETQVQSNQAQSDQAWSGVKAEKGRVLHPEPKVIAIPKRRPFPNFGPDKRAAIWRSTRVSSQAVCELTVAAFRTPRLF